MEEWKECKLEEISKNITDGTHSTVIDDISGNYFLLSCKNVKNGIIQISNSERKINKETFEKLRKRTKLEKDDILVTTVGTIGEMAIITDHNPHYEFQRSVGIIKPNKDIVDPKFLYYSLKNELPQIMNRTLGAVQQCLFLGDIKQLSIKLPPLPTQQKIATILSSLDDKIELNNKINTNHEQQARALFKNEFVDFEPFGTEERIESPIGTMIPRSLKMVQVADIPHLLETGKRPKGGAVAEGVPSIGAENVKQLGVFDFSSNKFIPREYADSLGKGKINGYELLLYKDGGKPGTFIPHFSMFGEGFPYDECYINEHVFKLDFYDKGLNEFAYFYFNTEYVKNWLANNGGKAAIPGINQNDVNAIWIYDLENHKVKEFAKFVEPMFKQIFSNCKQNRELSTIRDTLLPKLMNGEIETNSIIINKR